MSCALVRWYMGTLLCQPPIFPMCEYLYFLNYSAGENIGNKWWSLIEGGETGEGSELKMRKTVTIAVDVSVGASITVLVWVMLPFPLNLVWSLFNVWLWVVAPSLLWWAKRREEEKQAIEAIYAASQKPLQQESP